MIYKMFLLVMSLCIIVAVYYESNERITLREEDIYIENLPAVFENYKILQVTDLHEKKFGSNQIRLIESVNEQNYDAIVFTGDMMKEDESNDYEPIVNLLEGIENLESAWFVEGNTDSSHQPFPEERRGQRTPLMEMMEERGVEVLESIHTISQGNDQLIFTDFEMYQYYKKEGVNTSIQHLQEHTRKIEEALNSEKNIVLISLYHYPLTDTYIDELYEEGVNIDELDLHIAGHYHGGQIRIPFLGAVFIPEVEENSSEFFPDQDRVRWHWEYRGVQQYVSTGLGSSNALPLLDFRLFNPPEINMLTLKSK
jgi:uncharacterized protein